MPAQLSPLSPAEQAVAEQNFSLVFRFLRKQQLPVDDWFDVVIFRYLLTVKNWFSRPDLYKYEFSTIAWRAMASAVHNERQKQSRRIQTISLDDPIPGTDGLRVKKAGTPSPSPGKKKNAAPDAANIKDGE